MLDKKVVKLLNEQINKEMYSAYLYLDFANYFKHQGLDGFANWYNVQAKEERDHAMLFVQSLVLEVVGEVQVEIGGVHLLVDLVVEQLNDLFIEHDKDLLLSS